MKWGVLGAANIAVRSVMPAIQAIKENELVAVASRSQAGAETAAAPFGIAAIGSYEGLLERNDIEAVYVPLPNSLHYEWVTKTLEAGKHVLVEKSAFVSLEEAEKAVALARAKGLAIVENFQFQHHGQHRKVRALLAEGAIGQVRSIRASFGFPPFGGDANIRYKPELGGGALLDSGAYTLKATSFLFGNNFEVKAAQLTYNEQYGVDWFGGAFLVDEAQGLFSEVAWGFENYYQCNYEIWGSTGKLTATRAYTAKSDFKPSILLEQNGGTQELVLDADDHFHNMLTNFNGIIAEKSFDSELENILVQARLIDGVQKLGGFRG
ncbi:MAG: Gfo/Idh/MocA family oxidoreductase [Chitinophagaceae bacterium]|nr:MAG: Gfo/Idh/MocA family oxidoreductase [Chitinophagaceae bacterium]